MKEPVDKTLIPFFFQYQKLNSIADEYKKDYLSAFPFPHCVIDNFLDENIAEAVLKEFPGPKDIQWITYDGHQDKKLESKNESELSPFLKQFLNELNSSAFIKFLEKVTGISGLIPDPHFFGGGLHQIERTGFLKIHADFNYQPKLKLDRRINVIIYFNKNWKEEYSGHFELWDKNMKKCEKKVLPIFNRCVIFNTTDFSFHGHPEPLNCPQGETRKSIALYYYTNGRPSNESSTLHSTLFQTRPGEVKKLSKREIIKSLFPPILWTVGRSIKNKLLPET